MNGLIENDTWSAVASTIAPALIDATVKGAVLLACAWGAVLLIIVGISCWIIGGWLGIAGLDEAGRALVYVPLGSLFGMSIPR